MAQSREERLRADLVTMTALKEASTIFDFEAAGEAPDRYTVIFRGKGVCRDSAGRGDVEFVDLHRCDIRLPYAYPERPPDLRWLTPLFHPNVSFSGFISMRELDITWEPGLGLDVVCERLWDVARLAYKNLDKASNYSAKSWFEKENTLRLPLDHRPLRDQKTPASSNVIHYERRGDQRIKVPAAASDADVLYIGDDTPLPDDLFPRVPPRRVPPRRTAGGDDIVFLDGR